MTQILVKNRAMINCKDNYCITPLNLAKDCKEIIEYFMNTYINKIANIGM